MYFFQHDLLKQFERHFERLYGKDRVRRCLERLNIFLSRYDNPLNTPPQNSTLWSEQDVMLITYGDMVTTEGEQPLHTLNAFLSTYAKGTFNTIHILPFFPYSSDDGFSIIDYRQVNQQLGDWNDIQNIADNYFLGVDLVLNHVSRQSSWFQDYVAGVMPHSNYFIEASPDEDLSTVVRPRSGPLLTCTPSRAGNRHLWTTFSEDQIDLDFSNPDVFFDFLDILLMYIENGARIIRLDAIAYLWKKLGTSCIHLPQTHEIVKLLRHILQNLAPGTILFTETNVPQEENLSYFGDGDEAHMVYQFPLPPLLLHALVNETSEYLNTWLETLPEPPEHCTFLNFTASHDGIGVRPLEGLVPTKEINNLCEMTRQKGGFVSTKKDSDGSESPYELNITYYNALADAENDTSPASVARFICSQLISLELKGIPAIYFNSLFGARNNIQAAKKNEKPRSINRQKWQADNLKTMLDDDNTREGYIYATLIAAVKTRTQHPAFHPDGDQQTVQFDSRVFAVERMSPDKQETVLCLNNLSNSHVTLNTDNYSKLKNNNSSQKVRDILTDQELIISPDQGKLILNPLQTLWLKTDET